MGEKYNAHCSICGKPYSICKSCSNVKSFIPWRTVADTIEHYMIYMAIHGYTLSKNKAKAKQELNKCDLSGLKSFHPEIQKIIDEIMSSDNKDVEK